MRTVILNVLIPFLLLGAVQAAGQLPQEILADSYLLRVEQAIRDGDSDRARAEIDKVFILQKEHQLDLPDEFHFRYAKVAAALGLPEDAHEAVVKYLTRVGREGRHYVEALDLMNKVQDAIEGRKESQKASKEPPPPAQEASEVLSADQSGTGETPVGQEEKQALITADEPSQAQSAPEPESTPGVAREAVVWIPPPDIKPELSDIRARSLTAAQATDCENWNTPEYFRAATAADVAACLKQGAGVEVQGETTRYRPIQTAALLSADPKVIRVLIDAGANPAKRVGGSWRRPGAKWMPNLFYRPLHLAATYNPNPAITQALIDGGANVDSQSGSDGRPLFMAARRNNAEVLKVLIDAGADLDAKAYWQEGKTALHVAAEYNDADVVKLLIDAGANLESLDKNDLTPLHYATANNEKLAVRETLLAAGAGRTERAREATLAQEQPRQTAGGGLGAFIAAATVAGVGAASGASTEAVLAGVESVVASQQAATAGQSQTAARSSADSDAAGSSGGSGCDRCVLVAGVNDMSRTGNPVASSDTQDRPAQPVGSKESTVAGGSSGDLSGSDLAAGMGGEKASSSCLIPNFQNHDPAAPFRIPWCTSGGPQVETFAQYAAVLQCVMSQLDDPNHIKETRRRIADVCGRLDAMQRLGGNWRCLCPRGFGQ